MSQAGAASTSSGGSGTVDTLTGNSGGAVGPTAGNINVVGSGGVTVTGNPGTSTLTVSSGVGSSALTLIATQTATNQTSLTFTSGFSFNNYLLVGDSLTDPTTITQPYLLLQLSIDGGATYISTNYAVGNAGLVVGEVASNTSYSCFSCNIYNFTSGSAYILSLVEGVIWDPTGSGIDTTLVQDAYKVASTTANAFKLVMSDATAFSGVFSLYGYST